jgi:predicted deacylase
VRVYASLEEVPIAAGRHEVRIPVTTDMNGTPVVIWGHVLNGAQPGPTLLLLSGLHGNEWLHLHFFRTIVDSFVPDQTAGRLLVVPIANQVAFGTLSRAVRDDSDSPDTARAFPSGGRRFTWLAEQVAQTLADRILPTVNYLLDFHVGMWGSAMASILVGQDYSSGSVNQESWALARAFGAPLIFAAHMISGWPGPRTCLSYAGEVLSIPCCGSMLGGAGFDRALEEKWLAGNVRGVLNVMSHLSMIAHEIETLENTLVYEFLQRVNPRCGGLLVPVHQPDQFGRPVRAGELLGSIISPLSLQTVEELRSPVDGYLGYWARAYPVRPGDWAYGVIPADGKGTRWLSRKLKGTEL